MATRGLWGSIVALALAGCGGGGGTTDAAATPDTGPVVCGAAARPDLGTMVQNAQGLVVARDGTMYVTQPGGVGRRLPDGTLDTRWLSIAGTSTVAGLALDAANTTLFASALQRDATAPTLFRIDVASGAATPMVMGGFPLGLTVGADGMLYYTEVALGAVMRIAPTGGAATKITTSAITSPQGLAFEAAGTLIVAEGSPGIVLRLTLGPTGMETTRVSLAPLSAPTGVALDGLGRIYVASGFGHALIRMDADGTNQMTLSTTLEGGPQFFDFGHGALCGTDVFVAQGTVVRVQSDTAGAGVPWH